MDNISLDISNGIHLLLEAASKLSEATSSNFDTSEPVIRSNSTSVDPEVQSGSEIPSISSPLIRSYVSEFKKFVKRPKHSMFRDLSVQSFGSENESVYSDAVTRKTRLHGSFGSEFKKFISRPARVAFQNLSNIDDSTEHSGISEPDLLSTTHSVLHHRSTNNSKTWTRLEARKGSLTESEVQESKLSLTHSTFLDPINLTSKQHVDTSNPVNRSILFKSAVLDATNANDLKVTFNKLTNKYGTCSTSSSSQNLGKIDSVEAEAISKSIRSPYRPSSSVVNKDSRTLPRLKARNVSPSGHLEFYKPRVKHSKLQYSPKADAVSELAIRPSSTTASSRGKIIVDDLKIQSGLKERKLTLEHSASSEFEKSGLNYTHLSNLERINLSGLSGLDSHIKTVTNNSKTQLSLGEREAPWRKSNTSAFELSASASTHSTFRNLGKINSTRAHITLEQSIQPRNNKNDIKIQSKLRNANITFGSQLEFPELSTTLDASFGRIVTSTPKPHFSAIDYSKLSTDEKPSRSSLKALCLAMPKGSPKALPVNDEILPLDLRADPKNSNRTQYHDNNETVRNEISSEIHFSKTNSDESNWVPNSDTYDSDDEDSIDGDPTFLNDLTIHDYFQQYHTFSDDDMDDDSDVEENDMSKRSSDGNLVTNLSTHSNPDGPTHTSANITLEAVDNIEKQHLIQKLPKEQLRQQIKRCKEKGLQYMRKDGTVVPARQIKPGCKCKLNCIKKYPDATRALLLANLLNLKNSGQNQFIANHMSVSKTARPKVLPIKLQMPEARSHLTSTKSTSIPLCADLLRYNICFHSVASRLLIRSAHQHKRNPAETAWLRDPHRDKPWPTECRTNQNHSAEAKKPKTRGETNASCAQHTNKLRAP